MQKELLQSIIGTFVRTITTSAGAYLVGKGYITENDFNSLISGGVLLLATLGWSVYQKIQASKLVQAALSLPSNATIEDVKAEVRGKTAYINRAIPLFLIGSLDATQAGCFFRGNDPVAKPAVYSAQSAAALAGVQDVLIVLYDNQVIKEKSIFAKHDKVTTGLEVFYARIQANGYDKKNALTAIQQVIADVESFQNDVAVVSDPNTKAKLQQVFFTLQFTLNSIKAVIEATKEPDPSAVIATRDRLLQATPYPWWNSVILIAQETALRMIAQSRMTKEQAWADTAAIVAAIHQKNTAKLLET